MKQGPNDCKLMLHLVDDEWQLDFIDHDRQIVRAIVFDDVGDFYFVRVDRDDDFGIATTIETAGGGVEAGEDLECAIRRELAEELGADVEVLCEHLIFFMAGALVAWPISLVLGMPPSGENLNTIGIFLICYLIGVIFAVSQVTSGQIMQILKGKE